MPEGLIDTAARATEPSDRRLYGVTMAQVVNNVDLTGQARVQVRLPCLAGSELWARIAGVERGTYMIPQVGDEVLVAFNHGDIREPYIVGSLWNGQDRPPAPLPTDAVTKRIIRTPLGAEIQFDDLTQSIAITSVTQQTVTMDPLKVEIATAGGAATVTIDTAGNVSIKAALGIELKAPTITLEGGVVNIKSAASTSINGGAACNIQAGLVKIN